jgi:hypothetical protein
MQEVLARQRPIFQAQDWQAVLDNAQAALEREHTPANERDLKGSVELARQRLREQAATAQQNAPQSLAGTWAINANGHLGKLEINGSGDRLTGRLWLGSRWEELSDVGFDGRTLTFTRPIQGATQRYTGTIAGEEVKGTFTQQGTSRVYTWSSQMKEPAGQPTANGGSIIGTWAINGNGYKGKLEISQQGSRLSGRVWYDAHGRWEELQDVGFDGHTLTFTRPIPNLTQRYTGIFTGDEVKGTFTQQGTSRAFPWSAQMQDAASPGASSSAQGTTSLSLDRTVFKPGEAITVHFTALATWPNNAWVGIIPSRIVHGKESENDRHDVTYQYLKKRTSGSLTFKAPGVGDWDLRMHDTDSNGKEVASVSFKVDANANTNTNASSVQPGPVVALAAGPTGQISGTWKTSVAELTVKQSGTQISGTYKSDGGEIEGEMNGNVLEGWWIENNSSKRCSSTRNGRKYWGRISWSFEGDKFAGAWSYCDSPVPSSGNRWTGERIGAEASPSASSDAGTASTYQGYEHTPNAAISGHNVKQLSGVSVSDCVAACNEQAWCKSFDYYKSDRKCDLSDKQAADVGGLKRDYSGNPYDHYSRNMDSVSTLAPPQPAAASAPDSLENSVDDLKKSLKELKGLFNW